MDELDIAAATARDSKYYANYLTDELSNASCWNPHGYLTFKARADGGRAVVEIHKKAADGAMAVVEELTVPDSGRITVRSGAVFDLSKDDPLGGENCPEADELHKYLARL